MGPANARVRLLEIAPREIAYVVSLELRLRAQRLEQRLVRRHAHIDVRSEPRDDALGFGAMRRRLPARPFIVEIDERARSQAVRGEAERVLQELRRIQVLRPLAAVLQLFRKDLAKRQAGGCPDALPLCKVLVLEHTLAARPR